MTTSISSLEIRTHLGELLEQAYYQNKTFRILRKDKPMAWLVSEVFMRQVEMVIDQVIQHEPALADTLAITLDPDIRAVIEQGNREVAERQFLPIESILDES